MGTDAAAVTGSKLTELIETGEHCPECGQPLKIGIVRLFGVEKRFNVVCACIQAKHCAEIEAIERRGKLHDLYCVSGLTAAQKRKTFEGWEQREGAGLAYRAARRYVEAFQESLFRDGVGLYLHGPTGNGKSRLICAIANALLNRMVSVVYWNVPSLLEALKATYDGRGTAAEIVSSAHNCSLLILDDIGSEKPTEWTRNTLYEIINSRIESVYPTIVTSNYAPDTPELAREDVLGRRIMSRLNDREIFPPVANTATDYRREPHGSAKR